VENKFIKILIIEDELTSSKTLNSFLHTVGEIDIAVNGNKALTAVKKALENNQPYDLIFLDIMLPELDGITVLKKIRQFESQHGVNEHARSKIIMTSANTDKNIILKAARADCTAYLIKPIDKTRLYNEIRKHGFGNSE
jgi:two-component system chemotaxis response regulator CheY